jgi:uncharacterized membrane protein
VTVGYTIWRRVLARGAFFCFLALTGSLFSLTAAQADSCSDHDSDAVRASSDPKFDFVVQSRGDVCVIADYDDQSMDYYTRSESRCRTMPGMIDWHKDRGAGYNLCIFDPPSGSTADDNDSYDEQYQSDTSSDDDSNSTEYDPGGGTSAPAPKTNPSKPTQDWFSAKVCNKTGVLVYLAVAGRRPDHGNRWVVTGWWNIHPGDCANLGSFKRSKFYLYAESKGGRSWSGSQPLCTRSKKFWYYAEGGKCSEKRNNFYQRTISPDINEWTETLVPR